MRAMLNVAVILDNIPSEEHLLDHSQMDSIFAIRKLIAAAKTANEHEPIMLGGENAHGQRYSEDYKIWFNKEEFVKWVW